MVSRDVYVAKIATLYPPQGLWKEDDYFALPETMRIIELSDGELIMNAAATPQHQRVCGELQFALESYVREQQIGVVFSAPTALRLKKGKIREPDLFVVHNDRLGQVGEKYVHGPVDWVAEVISKGSGKTDRVDKLKEYEQAGIPEYWLVDPRRKTIRVYVLTPGSDAYTLRATYTAGEVAHSEILSGFSVAVDTVFSF